MTNIDPAIVEALARAIYERVPRPASPPPPWGSRSYAVRENFRSVADALAPIIAAAVDAARAEGYEQGKAAVREAVDKVLCANPVGSSDAAWMHGRIRLAMDGTP